MEDINKIQEMRTEMIRYVNMVFDEITRMSENRNSAHATHADDQGERQSEFGEPELFGYVMSINSTSAMKGRKPIAVLINGERIACPTWKQVFVEVLRRCNAIPECSDKLMLLRNNFWGKKRVIISDNKNSMRSPQQIDPDLYVETHYDTQTLMDLLLRILQETGYDYKNISISVRPR